MNTELCINHGEESRDLNDRVHGISCWYSDNQVNKLFFFLIPNQFSLNKADISPDYLKSIFHLKVTPQCAVVFHTSPNKYCFLYFDFARTSAENYYTV